MNPQEFDALISAGTGFYTPTQMAGSDMNRQMAQQALHNIQMMQTPVATGSVPAAPSSPTFERLAREQQAASEQFFVLLNGAQKGPLTLEQLKGLAIADVIDENTQVWRQGTPQWTDMKTCLAGLQ